MLIKELNNNTVCLACSIFKAELKNIFSSNNIDMPIKYFDSMLHMDPEKLQKKLDKIIETEQKTGNKILLICGECHNHMDGYDDNTKISRTTGKNCIELFLGTKLYKELEDNGAFFFLYEWAKRWRETFENHLGLKGKNAKEFMKELHKYLLYIDTGTHPVPVETMNEASKYLGLPWKTLKINTNQISNSILAALNALKL